MLLVAAVSTFLLSGPAPASAADEALMLPGTSISANVSMLNQYRWRGLDQSNTQPAIQGGFDLAHTSGLYIGTWMSNVDWGTEKNSTELDIYGGYGLELPNGVGVDLNFTAFEYPGAAASNKYDFQEYGIGLSKDIGVAALSAGFNFTGEFFGSSGSAEYIQAGLDIPLPADFGLSAHVGHQSIEQNGTYGVDDYTDWSVGVGFPLAGLDVSVTYVDTDLDITGITTTLEGRDEAVVFGASKSF
ncbi:MAG: TorF family putative porin [Nitrospinaceae bacterium]|nr:TorF family putative porin [Nitrospinaceae bacterium]